MKQRSRLLAILMGLILLAVPMVSSLVARPVAGHPLAALTTHDYTSTDVPKAIPDADSIGITSTITVTGLAESVYAISVTLSISHTYDADLIVSLTNPQGATSILINQAGGNGNNFTETVLTASASNYISGCTAPCTGSYYPQQAMPIGGQADGVWTLKVEDMYGGDTGILLAWSLSLDTDPTPPSPTSTPITPTPVRTARPTSAWYASPTPTPAVTVVPVNLPGSFPYGEYTPRLDYTNDGVNWTSTGESYIHWPAYRPDIQDLTFFRRRAYMLDYGGHLYTSANINEPATLLYTFPLPNRGAVDLYNDGYTQSTIFYPGVNVDEQTGTLWVTQQYTDTNDLRDPIWPSDRYAGYVEEIWRSTDLGVSFTRVFQQSIHCGDSEFGQVFSLNGHEYIRTYGMLRSGANNSECTNSTQQTTSMLHSPDGGATWEPYLDLSNWYDYKPAAMHFMADGCLYRMDAHFQGVMRVLKTCNGANWSDVTPPNQPTGQVAWDQPAHYADFMYYPDAEGGYWLFSAGTVCMCPQLMYSVQYAGGAAGPWILKNRGAPSDSWGMSGPFYLTAYGNWLIWDAGGTGWFSNNYGDTWPTTSWDTTSHGFALNVPAVHGFAVDEVYDPQPAWYYTSDPVTAADYNLRGGKGYDDHFLELVTSGLRNAFGYTVTTPGCTFTFKKDARLGMFQTIFRDDMTCSSYTGHYMFGYDNANYPSPAPQIIKVINPQATPIATRWPNATPEVFTGYTSPYSYAALDSSDPAGLPWITRTPDPGR